MNIERGDGNTTKRVFDQIFSQYTLLALAGVLILVSLVSILRDVYREQGFHEFSVSCEGDYDLKIIAPWTLPVVTNDLKGKPITIQAVNDVGAVEVTTTTAMNATQFISSLIELTAINIKTTPALSDLLQEGTQTPFQVALIVEPPYYLLDEQGKPLTQAAEGIPSAPESLRVFLKAEPTGLPLVNRHHPMKFVTNSVVCRLPSAEIVDSSHALIIQETRSNFYIRQVGEGSEISINILREGVIQSAIFKGLDFLSTAEAWAALLISLGGGVLTLKLREWDAKKKFFETDVDTLLNSDDLLGALQKLHEIEKEPSYPEYEEILLRTRRKVYTRNNISVLMKIASQYYLTGDVEIANNCLRKSLEGKKFWEKSNQSDIDTGLMLDELKLVAQLILGRLATSEIKLAASAVFELYDKNKFEYYGLIIRGIDCLWESNHQNETCLLDYWTANRRPLLLDSKFKNRLEKGVDPMPPTINNGEYYSPPANHRSETHKNNTEIWGNFDFLVDKKSKNGQAWHNASLLTIEHDLDALFLQKTCWGDTKFWPIALPIHPDDPELFTDDTLIQMCKALSISWLQVARGIPILDFLVDQRRPLLGSLLVWATGGTKSTLLNQLMRTRSVITIGGDKEESKLVEINEDVATSLVDRLYNVSDLSDNPSRSLLHQWLHLCPPGFEKNLFILIDRGQIDRSGKDNFCWIDEHFFNQRTNDDPIFKLCTMRPTYFVPSNRFVKVFWDTADIEKVINSARGPHYFMKDALHPLAAYAWKGTYDGKSVERRIAECAARSLGKAVEMVDTLDALHQKKGGGKVLLVEDLDRVIKCD